MIRINLLPYREKAEKENLARQIILFAGSLVLFVLIIATIHLYVKLSISGLETKIKEAETKMVGLDKKVGDIERFKRDKKDVEQKLQVIKSLEGNRLFPVQMLDELNTIVPARDIWLERVAEVGSELRIEGVARSNDVVASFMKSLEKASFIKSVDLVLTKEKEVSGVKLQQFSLVCVLKTGI
jgi:type IV pilus assembly protein PilN